MSDRDIDGILTERIAICADAGIPVSRETMAQLFLYEQLLIKWQRSKNFIIETDTLFNTGLYKKMIIECTCTLITPYPFFMGFKYEEKHMYAD